MFITAGEAVCAINWPAIVNDDNVAGVGECVELIVYVVGLVTSAVGHRAAFNNWWVALVGHIIDGETAAAEDAGSVFDDSTFKNVKAGQLVVG